MTKIERFKGLPLEKQEVIIDAAMSLFGAMGYKKTSVADISSAAGIAKAMVFYYFGSKKALYLFLIEFAGNTIKTEINNYLDMSVTDFFDKIRLTTEIKMSTLKKFPGIFSFIVSMYYETDKEVVSEIKHTIIEGVSYANTFVINSTDTHKFKSGIDPELVLEILTNYAEGYMAKVSVRNTTNIDLLLERFYKCLDLMKNNFYKDEYL